MKELLTYVVAALLGLTIVYLAFGAPAPVARSQAKERPPSLVGTWDLTFDEQTYHAHFSGDGVCRAWEQGGSESEWVGTWSLDGQTLVVWERESDTPADAAKFGWSVLLGRRGHSYDGRVVVIQYADLSDVQEGVDIAVVITNRR